MTALLSLGKQNSSHRENFGKRDDVGKRDVWEVRSRGNEVNDVTREKEKITSGLQTNEI